MFPTLLIIAASTLIAVHLLRASIQPKYDELNTERIKCLENALKKRIENHGESNPNCEELSKIIDDIWLENKYLILDVKASSFPFICRWSLILFILTLIAFFINAYPGIAIPEWIVYLTAALLGAFLGIIYSQLYREIDYYMKVKSIIK